MNIEISFFFREFFYTRNLQSVLLSLFRGAIFKLEKKYFLTIGKYFEFTDRINLNWLHQCGRTRCPESLFVAIARERCCNTT